MTRTLSTSEQAASLFAQVSEAQQATYTKGEVKLILNNLAQASDCRDGLKEVERVQRGDVFVAKMVGGKVRPWIALSVSGDIVTAVAMSSGDKAPRMVKARSRYWPGSWVGTTVSLFDHEHVRQSISLPYANNAHLREVEAHLASLIRLRPAKKRAKS